MDFLARFLGGDERLIQVCADMSAGPTLEREVCGLNDAAREFPRASRHIITLTPEAATTWPEGVTVHAAERWLLTEDHQED